MQTRTCTRTRANSRRKRTSDNPSCTIVHWLWVACAALCTCQAGRGLQPWRPTPEACAKIADASGHTPAHEHEGLTFTLYSIFLYGRIPDFSRSVRKQSICFPLSYGRIRSSWLYCCTESICFTAEPEEKTFASVRSILFCTAIMGEFFFLSVKSRISCANGNGHSTGPVISRCVACVLAIHAQVLGVGRQGLMAAPRPPCAWQHTGNPQLMNSPGARGETYGRTLHKSKPASISGNNHGLGCTNETESMSVCIHIKGFDGIW